MGDTIGGKKVVGVVRAGMSLGNVVDLLKRALTGTSKRIWYRGEPEIYPNPATPSLARSFAKGDLKSPPVSLETDFQHESYTFPLTVFTEQEKAIVEEVSDNPPKDRYFDSQTPSHDPAWLALARHHGKPTRLLDVSSDIFVSLFFACRSSAKKDAVLLAYVDPWDPDSNGKRPTDYRKVFDPSLGDLIPAERDHWQSGNPNYLTDNAQRLFSDWHARKEDRGSMAYLFRCEHSFGN